jgi:hypothetical protein
MQKILIKALVFGTVVAGSSATHAGLNSASPVEILTDASTGLRSARGSLRDARDSADSVAYIGCNLFAFDSDSSMMLCQARDAAGTSLFCSTQDPGLIQLAAAINPATFMRFWVNEDGFTCDHLTVSPGSYNL